MRVQERVSKTIARCVLVGIVVFSVSAAIVPSYATAEEPDEQSIELEQNADLIDIDGADVSQDELALPEASEVTDALEDFGTECEALATSSSTIFSGTCGTCPWVIDSDGTLTIYAGELDGDQINMSAGIPTTWPWYPYGTYVKRVVISGNVHAVGRLVGLFYGCSELASADLQGLNTSDVWSMVDMFNGCSSIEELDLSMFDTSNVTYMTRMFSGCTSLKSVDVSNFDTSSVCSTAEMFRDCASLTSLDLSSFNTSEVTTVQRMFYGDANLTSLDLSAFDLTSCTEDGDLLFGSCGKLMNLTLGSRFSFPSGCVLPQGSWAKSGTASPIGGDDLMQLSGAALAGMWVRAHGNVAQATISVTASYGYTGTAITPKVTVKLGTQKLVEGTDYLVYFENNVKPGTATLTVKGWSAINEDDTGWFGGLVSGTKNATFKITCPVSKLTVTAPKAQTYTGKALVPKVGVKLGATTLKSGTDYSLSYKNANGKTVSAGNLKAAGTYVVTITGKGAYTGSRTVKFTIAKAANPMVAKAVARTASLKTLKTKAVTVARPMTVTKQQGKLTYTKVASGSSAALTVNKTTGKVTVRKGTKKGTYTIKIKVTAAGNANYKAGSKTIACKVVVK